MSPSTDERLGRRLYSLNQSSAVLRLLVTIVSFSADEAIWFGISGVFISGTFGWSLFQGVLTGVAPLPPGCLEQCLSDCFGTMCVAGVVEVLGKLAFRRDRPLYAPQRTDYSLPAEQFSMPSGHSMRAAIVTFWLIRNPHAELLAGGLGLPIPSWRVAIPWACFVALSRVLKGKV